MLRGEKTFLVVFFLFASLIFIDINTPIGNSLFERVSGRSDRFAVNEGKNIGFINRRGRLVIPPQFQDTPHYFHTGFVPVLVNGLWGYIDKDGIMMIEPKFSWAGEFVEDLALVSLKGDFLNRFGYINHKGEYVIEPQFMEARAFTLEGLAAVKSNNQWGYINRVGEWGIAPQFQDAKNFQDNLAPIKKNGKWGYIEKSGLQVILPQWDDAKEFSEGLAAVKRDNLWGFIDRWGNLVIPNQFKSAGPFQNGISLFQKFDRYGTIDREGLTIFEKNFIIQMRPFSEGLSAVQVNRNYDAKKKGKWGYMDPQGQWIIEPQFDLAWDFHGGLARIGIDKNNPLRGYVNRHGKLIWDPGDWHLATTVKAIVGNVLIVLALLYSYIVYTFTRSKRKRFHLLRQIRSKLKGGLIGFGLFSEPKVKFLYRRHVFLMYSIDPLGFNYQAQTILETGHVFEQELYKSIYIYLEKSKEEAGYIEPSVTLALNERALSQNPILQRLSDYSILQEILKTELRNHLAEFAREEFSIKLSLVDGCFQADFYGSLSTEKEYDWFLNVGFLAFENFQLLDAKIVKLFEERLV